MKGIVGKERRNSQQFTAFVWVEENVKKCEICEKHEASIARAMQNDDDEEEKKIDLNAICPGYFEGSPGFLVWVIGKFVRFGILVFIDTVTGTRMRTPAIKVKRWYY